jgi:hypothetical protein
MAGSRTFRGWESIGDGVEERAACNSRGDMEGDHSGELHYTIQINLEHSRTYDSPDDV